LNQDDIDRGRSSPAIKKRRQKSPLPQYQGFF